MEYLLLILIRLIMNVLTTMQNYLYKCYTLCIGPITVLPMCGFRFFSADLSVYGVWFTPEMRSVPMVI